MPHRLTRLLYAGVAAALAGCSNEPTTTSAGSGETPTTLGVHVTPAVLECDPGERIYGEAPGLESGETPTTLPGGAVVGKATPELAAELQILRGFDVDAAHPFDRGDLTRRVLEPGTAEVAWTDATGHTRAIALVTQYIDDSWITKAFEACSPTATDVTVPE